MGGRASRQRASSRDTIIARAAGLGGSAGTVARRRGCLAGCLPRPGSRGSASRRSSIQLYRSASFVLIIKTIDGQLFSLPSCSGELTVAALKEMLQAQGIRFLTHRVDLVWGSRVLGDDETLGSIGLTNSSRLVAVFTDLRAAALVIGGGVAGRTAVHELSGAFEDGLIVMVDPQEYYEHTSGIVRAVADPDSLDDLHGSMWGVASRYHNVRFVHGEVMCLRAGSASVSSASPEVPDFIVRFDFCIIATGCNVAPSPVRCGESLWKPSSLEATRAASKWPKFDEREEDERQSHIQEEHDRLELLDEQHAKVLVVGANYQGVELACDLKHYFKRLSITLIDASPRCLWTMPQSAADYAEQYMQAAGIRTIYKTKFEPESGDFWVEVGLPSGAHETYVMNHLSARNSFVPAKCLSLHGPGKGGWVVTNTRMQVSVRDNRDRPVQTWASGTIFAVGDCHFGAVVGTKRPSSGRDPFGMFTIPPVPKTVFAAECWALLACRNIVSKSRGLPLEEATWPCPAGLMALSLGPEDGIVAWKVAWAPSTSNKAEVVLFGEAAAEMKRQLTWPQDLQAASTDGWLNVVKRGLPAGWRIAENVKAFLRLPGRAW